MKKNNKTDMKKSAKQNYNCDNNNNASKNSTEKTNKSLETNDKSCNSFDFE